MQVPEESVEWKTLVEMWIEKINKTCFEKNTCLVLNFQSGALSGSLDLKWLKSTVFILKNLISPNLFKKGLQIRVGLRMLQMSTSNHINFCSVAKLTHSACKIIEMQDATISTCKYSMLQSAAYCKFGPCTEAVLTA